MHRHCPSLNLPHWTSIFPNDINCYAVGGGGGGAMVGLKEEVGRGGLTDGKDMGGSMVEAGRG